MKSTLLTLLLFTAVIQLNGQRKFSASLELSMGMSEVTSDALGFLETATFQSGRNAFLKAGYRLRNNLDITIGFGFLNTRQSQRTFVDFFEDADFIETVTNHQYVVIPVGLQYHVGSFYVSPEIGFGLNFDHTGFRHSFFIDGNTVSIHGRTIDNPDGLYHLVSVPLFLSFGNEFNLKPVKIQLGVKGYYSLNALSNKIFPTGHYYGIGIVTGVKF